jgi:hypothetical protein
MHYYTETLFNDVHPETNNFIPMNMYSETQKEW